MHLLMLLALGGNTDAKPCPLQVIEARRTPVPKKQTGGSLKITLVSTLLLLCGFSLLCAKAPKKTGSNVSKTSNSDKDTQIARLKYRLLRDEKFSSDKAENLRIAGEEANRLYGRICESAVRISATPQMVQSAFMTFLAYGGRNLVHSNNEALALVELCVEKLRARYPKISQAEIDSEIRKLVQGDL